MSSASAPWRYALPTELQVGRGARRALQAEMGAQWLLVCSQRGRLQLESDSILGPWARGQKLVVVDDVGPNPGIDWLERRAQGLRTEPRQVDAVLGFGGGSALDAAKVLAALLALPAGLTLAELIDKPELLDAVAVPRLVAIPTTAGTGSEVTPFATVWDHHQKRKSSLSSERIRPQLALVDADLMDGLPWEVTLATGLDVINQGMESLWNRNANTLTIELATRGVVLAWPALERLLGLSFTPLAPPRVVAGEEEVNGADEAEEVVASAPLLAAADRICVPDRAAREALAEGSLLVGMAIAHTRTALCHAISYPLTAHYGIAHGVACAFSMAEVASHVLPADDGRLESLAQRLFGARARAWRLPHRFWGLLEQSGVAATVRAQVPSLPELLALVDQMQTPGRADNLLREAGRVDIEGMLQRAWSAEGPEHPVALAYRTGARQRMPRALHIPLEAQLGPLIAELCVTLDAGGVRCWLDSGSLLGVVRDGALPAWDKDVDIGVWREDVDVVRRTLAQVAQRHAGELEEKHLGGQPYAWVLTPGVADSENRLPLAVHVFDRVGEMAVSEQPHFLLAHRAAYARWRLRLRKRELGGGWRGMVQARLEERRLALLDLLHRGRLRKPIRELLRITTSERGGVAPVHAAEKRWAGWLHQRFQWVVPRRYFEELEALPVGGGRVWLPAAAEAYLALRYGETWRRPRKNWVYVIHDGTLVPRPRDGER